ncbi:F0F1 ATP synthase subunit A [Salipaludibacillus agaradhaerens]|uniref:ATP synthase subunit a n=1 Tax=Salipaludibacillus agaradhaerens TaxID=76935 RepID=A0A9Q4B5B4_SALAG|nr:F0F1 ATP synthase subunit A [Salipaludibacillus agaradhaerens]MCR6115563.1 F0F1 ATP synthase subunit A [Salipaludibacillus agaradhaerens]
MRKEVKRLDSHYLKVDLFGIPWMTLNIPNMIMTTVAMVIVFFVCFFMSRKIQMYPKGAQNALEYLVQFIKNIINSTMDWKQGKNFVMLGITIILYVFVANMLGVPFELATADHDVWWSSPTSNPVLTISLAAFVIVLTHIYGLKLKGPKEYGKDYFRPAPFMAPFKIIEDFSNTLTLGMRLYANIYAKEMIMVMLVGLGVSSAFWAFGAFVPLIVFQAFSVFIGSLQAFIFCMLTMVYMSHKVSEDH